MTTRLLLFVVLCVLASPFSGAAELRKIIGFGEPAPGFESGAVLGVFAFPLR